MKDLIVINNEDLIIRPSAVESFYGCAFAWGKTFLEGVRGQPNNRAAIGTAIHAGVEAMWNDAIASGKKDPNTSMMVDAAMEAYKEETSDGVQFGAGEDENTSAVEIVKGTSAFVEDIVPFSAIPTEVEQYFSVDIEHPMVNMLGGTVDYITNDTIADVKTSKRKTGAEGHTVQQSIYKYLANANGRKIENNLIQQVVLKKQPEGAILELNANIDHAKYLVNTILETLAVVYQDIMPIDLLLRPNPKHMFCSEKFCAHYHNCPAVKGTYEAPEIITQVKL